MFERATGGAAGSGVDRGGVGVDAGFAVKKLEIDCCFCELFGCDENLAVAVGILPVLIEIDGGAATAENASLKSRDALFPIGKHDY